MSFYKKYKSLRRRNNPFGIVRRLMDLFMGTMYLGIGSLVLFLDLEKKGYTFLSSPFNYLFGSVLVLYGLFRFYRLIIQRDKI